MITVQDSWFKVRFKGPGISFAIHSYMYVPKKHNKDVTVKDDATLIYFSVP